MDKLRRYFECRSRSSTEAGDRDSYVALGERGWGSSEWLRFGGKGKGVEISLGGCECAELLYSGLLEGGGQNGREVGLCGDVFAASS
jgi:hypothetical protein